MAEKTDRREQWEKRLKDLEERQAFGRRMGGPEKIDKHNRGGRLDARQRIDAICDKDNFVELGALVGGVARGEIPAVPADALVAGMVKIDGRSVLVGSECNACRRRRERLRC